MTHPILPAQSYEEALPYLRAPYKPSQVRALVINAPDNEEAPCGIALYAIGETAMDRFNLVCGGNWSRTFDTVDERQHTVDGVTYYRVQVQAVVVAFGVAHDDIGEGEAESRAAALMNARAQGWKRAGHWHGPGQCLYAAAQILMWRSGKDDELFVPKTGEHPLRRPYMKEGGQKKARAEYGRWLTEEGEAEYGAPLDHLAIYAEITKRASQGSARAALPPAPIETQRAASTAPPVSSAPAASSDAPPPAQGATATDPPAASAADVQREPMPNVPAAPETVRIAESINLTAEVAQGLSNLARDDGQTSALTERQQSTVLNWMVLVSDMDLTNDELVAAINFLAKNGTCQEARQVRFTRWLSAKASGATAPQRRAQASPAAAAPASDSTQEPSPHERPANDEATDAAPTMDESELDGQRALVRINRAMAAHGYSDRSVTQLAALAVGVGPKGKVDWEKIPPHTMQVLAELLESAGSLEWSPDFFAKEVLKAHNGTHQNTPAGRFSAFAGHLTDLAESRSVEAA